MQTYRMWITLSDGIRAYHNNYQVFQSDQEAISWITGYANGINGYGWYEYIDYVLRNIKDGKEYKGRIGIN